MAQAQAASSAEQKNQDLRRRQTDQGDDSLSNARRTFRRRLTTSVASPAAKCAWTSTGQVSTPPRKTACWLSQVFEVVGLCRALAPDGETPRACGLLIRFKNSDAKDVDLFINSDLLNGDFGRLGTALYEAGFVFDRGDAYRKMLHRYLANYSCSRRVTVVARTGWIEVGGKLVGFILPNETVLTEQFADSAHSRPCGAHCAVLGAWLARRLAQWRRSPCWPAHAGHLPHELRLKRSSP